MNIRPLFPLEHPRVTRPDDEKKVEMNCIDDDAGEDFIAKRDKQETPFLNTKLENKKKKKKYKKTRLLNIL